MNFLGAPFLEDIDYGTDRTGSSDHRIENVSCDERSESVNHKRLINPNYCTRL